MKHLLDSNAVSVWARRSSPQLLAKLIQVRPSDLCISSIVEMELLFGIELKPQFSYRPALQTVLSLLQVVEFDSASAAQAAKLRASLQRNGQPIGAYDALIAATALSRGLTLVTHNLREFARINGLAVQDWEAAAA